MENGITYTNKFSVISDAKKNEFIVTFYQEIPRLDEKCNVSNVETSNVGTFVMNRAMFSSLCKQLGHMLKDDDGDAPEAEKNG